MSRIFDAARGMAVLFAMAMGVSAQTPPVYTAVVAGSGYQSPPPITVAPGQIATFFVGGLPQTAAGLAKVVAVLNMLGQTQQAGVLSSKVVDTERLAITVQIPFGAPASQDPWFTGTYTIQFAETDNPAGDLCAEGACSGPVNLQATFAAPHLINTCDLFYTSAASTGGCASAVTHQSGALVTGNLPAAPGEILTAWAVGLGAPSGWVPGTNPAERSGPIAMNDITLTVTFNISSGTQTVVIRQPISAVSSSYLWAGLPSDIAGLYQINFAIPQSSLTGLGQCSGATGNLWITVGRTMASLFGSTGAVDGTGGTFCMASN